MKTIRLTYDGRNLIARKAIDLILSLGVFKVEEEKNALPKKTLQALKEMKNGDVVTCKDIEDYERKIF